MSWVDEYMAYTSEDLTSELYRRWCAVYAISSVIQRKHWLRSMGRTVYGNLFILLTGASTAGKGVALDPLRDILNEIDDVHIASASVSAASFVDELAEATVVHIGKGGTPMTYNALSIVSNEFGVLMPAYDTIMLNRLTDLYDNKGYDERRRGSRDGKRLTISRTILNIIGGCTPAYLNNTLPEGAWEEGFMSRTIVVHAGAQPPARITEEISAEATKQRKRVVQGLRTISDQSGQIKWTPEGIEFFNEWYIGGGKPAPTHPKLVTYCGRRHFNAMKLSMIYAVARGSKEISKADVEDALSLLFDTEQRMPDAFLAMKSGGDAAVIKELHHWMELEYLRTQKAIPRFKVAAYLMDRVPSHRIEGPQGIISSMLAAGFMESVKGNAFIPKLSRAAR